MKLNVWGVARRHMHDGMYPFKLGIVSFDIVLDHWVFHLKIHIDGSAEVVPPSLSYWVIEPCLMKGPRSRWS